MEYSVDRHSAALTKGDMMELFTKLEERVGSIAGVCRLVGIERRTFYHWRSAREVKEETKRKLLEVLLEKYPEESLEFLTDKGLDRAVEFLASLTKTVYLRAVDAEDREEFRKALRRFSELLEKYDRPVVDLLGDLGDLILPLDEKAREMGVKEAVVVRPYGVRPTPVREVREVNYFGGDYLTELPQGSLPTVLSGSSTISPQFQPNDGGRA